MTNKLPSPTTAAAIHYPYIAKTTLVTTSVALMIIAATKVRDYPTIAFTASSALIVTALLSLCCKQRTSLKANTVALPQTAATGFLERYPDLLTHHRDEQTATLGCILEDLSSENEDDQPLTNPDGDRLDSLRVASTHYKRPLSLAKLPIANPKEEKSPFEDKKILGDSRILMVDTQTVETVREFLIACHAYIDQQEPIQPNGQLPPVTMSIIKRTRAIDYKPICTTDAIAVEIDVSDLAHWRNAYKKTQ